MLGSGGLAAAALIATTAPVAAEEYDQARERASGSFLGASLVMRSSMIGCDVARARGTSGTGTANTAVHRDVLVRQVEHPTTSDFVGPSEGDVPRSLGLCQGRCSEDAAPDRQVDP